MLNFTSGSGKFLEQDNENLWNWEFVRRNRKNVFTKESHNSQFYQILSGWSNDRALHGVGM